MNHLGVGVDATDRKIIVFHMNHCSTQQIIQDVTSIRIFDPDTVFYACGDNETVPLAEREQLFNEYHVRFRPMSPEQLNLDPKSLATFLIDNLNKRILSSRSIKML